MTFRFQGSRIFLTYTQVPNHVNDLDNFKCLLKEQPWWKPTGYVLGRESHDDGGIHFHLLYCQANKFSTRNSRYWDLEAAGEVVHPNVQSVSTTNDVKRVSLYCQKEGNAAESRPTGGRSVR